MALEHQFTCTLAQKLGELSTFADAQELEHQSTYALAQGA
jgi:hypothetical protein